MADAEPMDDARATPTPAGATARDESAEAAHPVAVKGSASISVAIVLLALLVASVAAFLVSSPHAGGGGGGDGGVVNKGVEEGAGGEQGKRKGTEPVEHAVGDVGIPGFNSRLDAFRAWAKLTWMKLRRPRSDEPRYDDGAGVTEAAKKSFEMGKETVEQAAATAAKATGEAVEKTKEKVKGVTSPSSSDAEL
ncbi:hypothetical protein ACP4OV_012446 [Aristida adscensionis]